AGLDHRGGGGCQPGVVDHREGTEVGPAVAGVDRRDGFGGQGCAEAGGVTVTSLLRTMRGANARTDRDVSGQTLMSAFFAHQGGHGVRPYGKDVVPLWRFGIRWSWWPGCR